MDNIIFKERQKFRQWWVLLILLSINGVFIAGIYTQVINDRQFGEKPMSDQGLIIGTILVFLFTFLMLNFRLDTIVKRDGIYVRFFPFHLKFKEFTWDNLSKCYVRKYSPISEYGGWGLRIGFFGNGNALNVSGDKGLQLEIATNKKRLLIGTNKPEELAKAIAKLGQIKE
ncbi:MAG TPA: hypothetical protein VF676_03200 [Flavobacterium sp.]|jgi:hypothetical protein